VTDTERHGGHGPVPRRPAARLDSRTSYFDENQASQAKKPSKNDMPSPHRRIFCHCSRERPAPATAQAAPRLGQGRMTLAMGPRRPTSMM
jgi:hypothetical protein